MIHEYKTGRTICSFVEFLAWIFLVVAIIVLLVSLGSIRSSSGFSTLFAVQAVSSILGCLLILLIVQICRASMDGSVASQKLVIETRKHHTDMISALRQVSYAGARQHVGVDANGARASAPGWSNREANKLAKYPNRPIPHGVPIAPAAYAETKKLSDVVAIEYRGDEILETPAGAFTRNRKFADLEDAKIFLDRGGSEQATATTAAAPEVRSRTAGAIHAGLEQENTAYQSYHGFRIYPEGMAVRVGDRKFRSLDGAQGYIDELRELEQKFARTGVGQLPYRNTTIVLSGDAFEVRGRTFTALSRATSFLDDQLEPAVQGPADDEQSSSVPDAQTDASTSPTLAADRRPPSGLG